MSKLVRGYLVAVLAVAWLALIYGWAKVFAYLYVRGVDAQMEAYLAREAPALVVATGVVAGVFWWLMRSEPPTT